MFSDPTFRHDVLRFSNTENPIFFENQVLNINQSPENQAGALLVRLKVVSRFFQAKLGRYGVLQANQNFPDHKLRQSNGEWTIIFDGIKKNLPVYEEVDPMEAEAVAGDYLFSIAKKIHPSQKAGMEALQKAIAIVSTAVLRKEYFKKEDWKIFTPEKPVNALVRVFYRGSSQKDLDADQFLKIWWRAFCWMQGEGIEGFAKTTLQVGGDSSDPIKKAWRKSGLLAKHRSKKTVHPPFSREGSKRTISQL